MYIQSLQQLILDSDNGVVLDTLDSDQADDTILTQTDTNHQNNKNSKVKNIKRVILDPKWTNYSQQFLQDKFSKDLHSDSAGGGGSPDSSSEDLTDINMMPELSMVTLPNIEDLLSTNIIESNNDNILTLQFSLLKESKVLSPVDLNMTDVSEYFQCLS